MRLILTSVLVVLLVSGCSGGPLGDDHRDARVGEVFDTSAQVEGLPVSFTLPTAGYEFVVTKPHSSATSSLPLGEDDDVSPEAGDDTSFIEVQELLPRSLEADTWMLAAEEVEWELWLEVDGRRFPLDREGHRGWVVTVPEDPDEVRLVAEYDGREFAVDPYDPVRAQDTGSAYAPGRQPQLREQACPEQHPVALPDGVEFNGTDCQVRVLDPVPWFGPAGWASAGRSWVLVRATIDINTYFGQEVAGEYVSRETEYGEPTYTFDGRHPTAMYDEDLAEISSRPDDMDVHDSRLLLFEVDEASDGATLRLALTYRGVPKDSADDAETVTHRWKQAFDLRFT